MSLIALPTGFRPNSFTMRLQTNQRAFASPFGGSEQVLDMGNDRLMVSMSLPNRKYADAAQIEAFIAALRGMTNTVAIYHWVRKVPRGTMRGTPTTINNPAAQGSESLTLQAAPGVTLLAGDLIGVSGLLLMVANDCTADGAGNIVVPLVNRLRKAIAAGTAVVWDKPTAPFRMISTSSAVQYIPGYATEVALDFIEVVN
jgi:hypothetical protein